MAEFLQRRVPVRREVTPEVQEALDKYLEDNDVKTLEKVSNERVAHVMDVIYKESVRTFEEECKEEFEREGSITATFITDYDMFDKDKVFFTPTVIMDDGADWTWSYPITIYKKDGEHHYTTPWETHNFLFKNDFAVLDEDGNIDDFGQDIDIFGDTDTWKVDLIKSLYMVVGALYDWWAELKEMEDSELYKEILEYVDFLAKSDTTECENTDWRFQEERNEEIGEI